MDFIVNEINTNLGTELKSTHDTAGQGCYQIEGIEALVYYSEGSGITAGAFGGDTIGISIEHIYKILKNPDVFTADFYHTVMHELAHTELFEYLEGYCEEILGLSGSELADCISDLATTRQCHKDVGKIKGLGNGSAPCEELWVDTKVARELCDMACNASEPQRSALITEANKAAAQVSGYPEDPATSQPGYLGNLALCAVATLLCGPLPFPPGHTPLPFGWQCECQN